MIINIWYYKILGRIIESTNQNYIDYFTEKKLYENDFANSRINLFISKLADNLPVKITWLLFFPCLLFFTTGLLMYFFFSESSHDNIASIIILCMSSIFFLVIWSLPTLFNLWYVYKYKIYNLNNVYRIIFIISLILVPFFLATLVLPFMIFDVMKKFDFTYKSH